MIHDFANHHGTDAWPGVRGTQRGRNLRHETFVAGADDVAAEGDAVLGCAKAEAVAVAGEVRGRVSREDVNLFALRAEVEVIGHTGVLVELRFIEHDIAACADNRVIGDAVFHGRLAVIGEEPAADVHVRSGGIVKLEGIHGRKVGVSQGLVDEDRWHGGRRIICSG